MSLLTSFYCQKVEIMKQICKFNKERDIMRTVPGLSVDLALAVENGVVLDTGVDAQYNDIEDPANIHGRVRDAFGAVDAQRAILKAGQTIVNKSAAAVASVNPTGDSD